MEKLELKHLAPYLPYGLRYTFDNVNYWLNAKLTYTATRFDLGTLVRLTTPDHTVNVIGINWDDDKNGLSTLTELSSIYHKPILRPMSDLEDTSKSYLEQLHEVGQTIEYSNGSFYDGVSSFDDPCWLPQICFEVLLENYFDVFGLIDKGLAIDINTLYL